MSKSKLTKQQKIFISLIQEKRFADLLVELLKVSLEEPLDFKKRMEIVDKLLRLLPNRNINVELQPEPVNWAEVLDNLVLSPEDNEDYEEYERWKKKKESMQ